VVPRHVWNWKALVRTLERRLVAHGHVQLVGSSDQLRADTDRHLGGHLGRAELVTQPARVLAALVRLRLPHDQPDFIVAGRHPVRVRVGKLPPVEEPRDFRLRIADVAEHQLTVEALAHQRVAEVTEELRSPFSLSFLQICRRITNVGCKFSGNLTLKGPEISGNFL